MALHVLRVNVLSITPVKPVEIGGDGSIGVPMNFKIGKQINLERKDAHACFTRANGELRIATSIILAIDIYVNGQVNNPSIFMLLI